MDVVQSEISNLLGYVTLGLILAMIAFDCRRDIRELVSARNVFLITVLAWYLLEAIGVPDEIRLYTQEEYHFGLIGILMCCFGFLVAYSVSKGGVFDGAFGRMAGIDRPKLVWTFFLIAVGIGFLPLVVIAKGNLMVILDDAFTSRGRWGGAFQRGRFGGARDAFLELQLFLRAALPLGAAVLAHPKQRTGRRIFAAAFLFYMISRALNDGTRSKVLEALMPLAAAIYWRMSPALKRKALMFGLPAISIVAMIWAAAAVSGRNAGTIDWDKATNVDYVGFEMFRELLYLQRHIPENSDFKHGHTYYVQMVNPIPRFLWPGKPIGDAGLELAGLRNSVANGADLTISPGLIGEMHWNGGIVGILLVSGLMGYLAKSWDRVRPLAAESLLAFTIFAAGLAVIFLSGRAINMPVLYGIIAILVLLMFFAKPKKRRKHSRNPRPGFMPGRN